jgi:RHS repeat-associated protein
MKCQKIVGHLLILMSWLTMASDPLVAQTVTYPPPSPINSSFPTTFSDDWVYSGCPPLPVPSSGSSSGEEPRPISAPLWWINGFPSDGEPTLAFSLPPSMANFLTLVNGVSEGQGTTTQTETFGVAGTDQVQETYTLTVSGSTVAEQLVVNTQSLATEGSQSQAGNYVDTFNSSYDIVTGVQTYSVNYHDTVILTVGCQISTTVVIETGSITIGNFALPPNRLGPAGTSTNPQAPAAEPISTGNGNYYYVHTDLSTSDHIAVLPLAFQRSYNSLDNLQGGPLGNNWTHNFNITIIPTFSLDSTAVTVEWGDGHSEAFTSNGISNSYISAPGATNTLTSDPTTGAYTITRKDGVQYFFSPYLQLQSIQDTNGRTITATQDINNNLMSLTSGEQTLTFSYDPSNRLNQVADQSGRTVSYSYDAQSNLSSETDPAGNITRYGYSSTGQLTSITLANGSVMLRNTYDSSGRVASQTNADGFKTTLSYGTPALGQTTITDPLGHKTVHSYDSSMRITGITDALGHTTSYSYDGNNNVASVTDARNNISKFTYDSFGNLLTYADPLGNTASFTYNSFSEPLTIGTPKGDKTTLTYDPNGNLMTVQNPLGDKTVFSYDGSGDLLSVVDSRNNTTNLSYGGCDFCITAIADPLGNKTAFGYDTIGRLITVTDPNGHATAVTYDALSHIISVTDPLGNKTLFAYNTVSNMTKVTDANGHATSYSYDAVGNLTGVRDALGHKTSYTYDKNNNLTELVNAKGNVATYTYNAVNRLTKVADFLQNANSYVYDPVGNVTSVTDANGKLSNFTYDKGNRLTKIAYADGTSVTYTYDPDSNRKTMVDTHGTTAYVYDALDRVLSVVFPGPTTLDYAYDSVGNRASVKYPDGKSVTYTYDADNRLSGMSDWLKRDTSYAYGAASNLTRITFPNTVISALTYDAASRLTGITDSANSVAYRVLAYTMDKVGNLTKVTDNSVATNYAYDAVNELLSSTRGTAKTSWTYDAVGNRIEQIAPTGTTSYTYDVDDRMRTAGSTTFTYDNNGNRLTEAGTSTTTYDYDAKNRLLSVAGPSETSIFTYDGDGNRITQTTPSGTYDYVNDTAVALPVVLNEKGPDGTIDYGYGRGLLESSSSAFDYFYSLDGLGSVSNLTNVTGTVEETYSYDAWGNALTATGSVGAKNKFRFTGQALDPATGLYFLRARYYDQAAGRFLSKDAFPGFAPQPITLHRFIYAGNNPATFVDPSGLYEVPITIGFAPTSGAMQMELAKAFAVGTVMGPSGPNVIDLVQQLGDLAKAAYEYDQNYGTCSVNDRPTYPPAPPVPEPPASFSSQTPGPTPVPLPAPAIGMGTTGVGSPPTCGVPQPPPPPPSEGTPPTKGK